MNVRHSGLVCLSLLALGCDDADFDPVTKVNSVRILAAQASKPYALPDDEVELELLADDGRIAPLGGAEGDAGATPDGSAAPSRMRVYWLKNPCINPLLDLYYACYPGFGAAFQPGERLDPATPSEKYSIQEPSGGSKLSVKLPPDIISSHPRVEGSAPFGTLFAFGMACAGDHVRHLGIRTKPSPQSPPFGCFDAAGNQLGADHFVFGFARVFAFENRSNTNPVIEQLTFGDQRIERTTPEQCRSGGAECLFTTPRCTEDDIDNCPEVDVNVVVPPGSQESDPSSDRGREQIWADFYATGGEFEYEARILYDVNEGRVSDTAVSFRTPMQAGDHRLWAVVHDNRGGVEWIQATLRVE